MNNHPRPPSRASTFASQDSKISSAQYAALSGATKAFGRPVPQQRTAGSTHAGANKASAAAATVGGRPGSPQNRRPARSPAPPLVASSTGGSVQSVQRDMLYAKRFPDLQPPLQQMRQQHSKSPSFQAASLAASRATPQPQPNRDSVITKAPANPSAARRPAAPPKPRRLSERHEKMREENAERPTDDTPILPTTSLVSLFERKDSQTESTSSRPEPIVIKPAANLALKSPKPIRTSGGLTSMFQMELPDTNDSLAHQGQSKLTGHDDSSSDSFASASEDALAPSSPGTFMQNRATDRVPPTSAAPRKVPEKSTPPSPPAQSVAKPLPIPKLPPRSSTSTSDKLSPSSASLKSLPAQYNQLYPRGRAPQMTGDQLANAMVASSLASSRISSPRREGPPPLHTQRPRHHTFAFSRTPSPTKGHIRHTLRRRDPESSDSEEEDLLHPYGKHKKKRHLRKHPNKHHEGDRKRWRDAVTERERKRYEGVWAANKGLHCSFTRSERAVISKSPTSEEAQDLQAAIGDQVSNIVVRDIWSRSRLPDRVLETVWDLVDNDCVGRLTKDEFVVGMFLIDYCLKGRKLPIKVSESVWASVRTLQGIKIRKQYRAPDS